MKNEAYSALAKVYEFLITDKDYEAWADYVVKTLKNNVNGRIGLDLACGSGYFTRAIKRAGYQVTGVDLSEEMLAEAQALTIKEGLNIPYMRQDMSALKVFQRVDFVTIINDGVNYLTKDRLEKTFKSIYKCLNKDGLLFFDFSTRYKLENVIGNNMFGEDSEECSYLWFNSLKEDCVHMDLSVFIKDGDKYLKREESHVQYVHDLSDVIEILKKCGYSSINVQNHLGGDVTDTALRIQITARR